jgi:hypothetical protein
MAQNHFLHHKTGFDGLAETHIVGNQQIDPLHGKRTDNRVKLIIVNLYAAAER